MPRLTLVAALVLFGTSAFAQVDPSVWYGAASNTSAATTVYEHRKDGTVLAYPLAAAATDWSVARDASGNVFFGDATAGKVRRFAAGIGEVSSFAVAGGLRKILASPDGSLWITTSTNAVSRVSASGGVLMTATASAKPWDVVVDANGNLWFTEFFVSSKLRVMSPAGVEVTILANTMSQFPSLAPLRDGRVAVADGSKMVRFFDASGAAAGGIHLAFNVARIAPAPCETLLCAYSQAQFLQRVTLDGANVGPAISVSGFTNFGQFDAAPDGTIWVTGAPVPFNALTRHYGRDGAVIASFPYGSVVTSSDAAGSQFTTIAGGAPDSDGDSFLDRHEIERGFDALDSQSRPDALRVEMSSQLVLKLQIKSPRHALAPYLVVAAFTIGQGPMPSAPCECPRIPLAVDTLLRHSLLAPPLLQTFAGTLDAQGRVTALAVVPPQLSGMTIQLSALLDDAALTFAVTDPVQVTLP